MFPIHLPMESFPLGVANQPDLSRPCEQALLAQGHARRDIRRAVMTERKTGGAKDDVTQDPFVR